MTAGITALTYTAFMVASVAVQVISAFSLTQVQFGAVTTVPFLAGAALGLPIGMLGDRFGVKHVVSIAVTSFLIQALVEGKELTSQAAGLSVMVLDLVAIVGAVGAGWIAQRAGRFRLVVIVLSLLSAAACYLVWRVPGVGLTLLLLGVVGLVEGGVTPVAKSLIPRMALREHLPMQSVGTAGGIHTSIMYLGAFLVPTYLVAAVAGDDFHKVFLMSALLVAAGGLVNLLIPRSVVGDRKRERKG
jgi:NNP family nitrate/nitrite transporter-like MFS transporter